VAVFAIFVFVELTKRLNFAALQASFESFWYISHNLPTSTRRPDAAQQGHLLSIFANMPLLPVRT
jgi:hypothetical protein